ncbi:hypothetical protein HYFRA_00007598 [Hymenoscyphus fraxineus]|uniref:Uncharacterized protein n=1 Tax=Hymenoscyphus fraxineus TaxID=746836 RepID=A0A9N9KSW7_9HELO|nr:hypothetical protein HYFRA_00007598 [Hymenoscyphus fraxineus]
MNNTPNLQSTGPSEFKARDASTGAPSGVDSSFGLPAWGRRGKSRCRRIMSKRRTLDSVDTKQTMKRKTNNTRHNHHHHQFITIFASPTSAIRHHLGEHPSLPFPRPGHDSCTAITTNSNTTPLHRILSEQFPCRMLSADTDLEPPRSSYDDEAPAPTPTPSMHRH